MPTTDYSTWQLLKSETVTGKHCELRYTASGKGRAKCHYWHMLIDGKYFTYAAIKGDVEDNWRYTLASAAQMEVAS